VRTSSLSGQRIVRPSNTLVTLRARAQHALLFRRQLALYAVQVQRRFVPPDVPATSLPDDDRLDIGATAAPHRRQDAPVYTSPAGRMLLSTSIPRSPASLTRTRPARRSHYDQSKVLRIISRPMGLRAIVLPRPPPRSSTVALFSHAWMLLSQCGIVFDHQHAPQPCGRALPACGSRPPRFACARFYRIADAPRCSATITHRHDPSLDTNVDGNVAWSDRALKPS